MIQKVGATRKQARVPNVHNAVIDGPCVTGSLVQYGPEDVADGRLADVESDGLFEVRRVQVFDPQRNARLSTQLQEGVEQAETLNVEPMHTSVCDSGPLNGRVCSRDEGKRPAREEEHRQAENRGCENSHLAHT
jgi:hypothetical protein